MLLSTIISIAGSRGKSRKICGKRCERSRSKDGRDREKSAGRRLPATTTEKSRAETRPLQALAAGALGMDSFGGLALADLGGEDFVGGGVAGALEGAPHVPTGDGAIGAPAFAEGEEFLGLGHMLFAVGYGPAFFDAEVVDGEDVGAAEAEDQEHFDGPGADTADGDETFDELFVGKFLGLLERRDDAVDGFLREVFHGEDFCAGETGFAEDGLAQLEH